MANFVQSPCDQAVIRAGATAVPCAKSSAPWILAATILGSSMAFIDGTVVNVALPALQWSLKATVVDVQWVVEAYSLLLASFLLVGGSLGDHYGRRRIFIGGVVLFSVASLWCGLATSIGQLILARAVQGAGGAALATIGLTFLVYGLIESSRLGFGHPAVLTALSTGSAFLALFVYWEGRARNPMLPLALFGSQDFAGANLLTLFLYSALGGTLFFLPLNLIQVQG